MEFPSPEINQYLETLTPKRNELLSEMEALADEKMFPAVGPQVGRLLYQIAKLSRAKMVFELGSGFAYSAMWLAMAIPDDGHIICTELDSEKAQLGLEFLERAGLRHKVLYEMGDAQATLRRYQGPFDLIFCDLNKEQYPEILKLAPARLKTGGLFIADNVLWSGRVLDNSDHSPATQGIRDFNERSQATEGLFTTIIPLRDGLSLSLKE